MEKKEQDILERIKKGDENAIIVVYDNYRKEFIQWCSNNYGTDEDEAADLFQDSVVAFYYNVRNQRLNELTSSLKTYLFAIGKNLALKRLNRESRMVVDHDVLELNSSIVPEDLFENSEKKKVVSALLNEMGEPCRSILKLFYFDRFAMDAIAARLGYKNEHVVKSQKLRCFNTLKKMVLERFEQDEI